MLDLVALAKETVTFLAPFLPYLLKVGEGAAEEAGKKIGEKAGGGAWEKAKAMWAKLRPGTEAKPAAQEAVQEVTAAPEDEDARAALRLQLKKLFAEDESLAKEISEMQVQVRQAGVNVAAIGDRSVAIGGNVSGSTIVTGNENKVGNGKDS
jgi:hypothetical protein